MSTKSLLLIIAISLITLNIQLFRGDIVSDAVAGDDCGKRYNPCWVRIKK